MQIIAMLTMLIDHIGIVFFPNELTWRIVGRIAFPIYTYCIVLGYQRTSNLPNYFVRLLLIFLVSQVPFMVAINPAGINAVGTLIVSLAVIVGIDRVKSKLAAVALIVMGCISLELFRFDYGAYGVLLALAYRYAKGNALIAVHAILNAVYMMLRDGWMLEAFSIFSTISIVYAPGAYKLAERIKVPRIIWRLFYPAHLTILALFVISRNFGFFA